MAATPRFEGAWPPLPLAEWRDTCATLHMWTQIVGKVRLALAPHVNHWWQVPLYVSARGLTTSAIPYGGGAFELEFDFVDHVLKLRTASGSPATLALEPRTVADFYARTMAMLRARGIEVRIWPMPVEVPDPVRFDRDDVHASYDRASAHRFWRVLRLVEPVFQEFRGRFLGKSSPVHFFWGSFDLAVTRFSGRPAPPRAGADAITREAYSHEVSSAGFWPGTGDLEASFYAYAAPEPPGFAQAPVRPAAASYHPTLKEFLLPYEAVRSDAAPGAALMAFLQSTYEAEADLARWDRPALERDAGERSP